MSEDTVKPTTWTERVNLTTTVKEGYRVGEVTVTCQFTEGDGPTREERRRRMMDAIADGQMVADRMNSERDQIKRFSN